MVAIKSLVLFAIPVFSAAISERTVAQINADLTTIDNDVKKLTTAVNAFDGSSNAALNVLNASNQVDKDVKQGTTDANNTPQSTVTASDCTKSIGFINNTLEPDVAADINALIAKKSQFAAGGYQSTVCNQLKTLKSDTDTFGAALIKLCPSNTSAGQAALAKIDADFNKGISAFC